MRQISVSPLFRNRTFLRTIFVLYLMAVFYAVFLTPNRFHRQARTLNYTPVIGTIQRFYGRGNEHFWPYYIGYWGNLVGNIFLFLPFGFLLTWLKPNFKSLFIFLLGLASSIFIESSQYIFDIGVSDIDDVILNSIGTLLGLWLAKKINPEKVY